MTAFIVSPRSAIVIVDFVNFDSPRRKAQFTLSRTSPQIVAIDTAPVSGLQCERFYAAAEMSDTTEDTRAPRRTRRAPDSPPAPQRLPPTRHAGPRMPAIPAWGRLAP